MLVAQAANVFLELAPGRLEGIADGDVDVFVGMVVLGFPGHHDFLAGQRQIDAHMKELALVLVAVYRPQGIWPSRIRKRDLEV